MHRHHLFSLMLLPAVLAFGSARAHAASVTMTGWSWGQGNAVGVKHPGFEGHAGGALARLSGSGVPGLDGVVRTYALDLRPSFSFGTTHDDYLLLDPETYFGTDKAEALAQLLGWVADNRLFVRADAGRRDDLSTALQLAIWNLRYDDDRTLSAGGFRSLGTEYAGALPATHGYWGANAMLRASVAGTARHTLWVLQSPTQRDLLVWQQESTVPEPATWALLGLAGLAAAAARRRVSAGA